MPPSGAPLSAACRNLVLRWGQVPVGLPFSTQQWARPWIGVSVHQGRSPAMLAVPQSRASPFLCTFTLQLTQDGICDHPEEMAILLHPATLFTSPLSAVSVHGLPPQLESGAGRQAFCPCAAVPLAPTTVVALKRNPRNICYWVSMSLEERGWFKSKTLCPLGHSSLLPVCSCNGQATLVPQNQRLA